MERTMRGEVAMMRQTRVVMGMTSEEVVALLNAAQDAGVDSSDIEAVSSWVQCVHGSERNTAFRRRIYSAPL